MENCFVVRRIKTSFWKSWTLCPPEPREEEDPARYQHSVEQSAYLMVWGGIKAYGTGNLHIRRGSINADMYIQVL